MKTKFHVVGMTCKNCIGLVQNALEEHQEVLKAEVDYDTEEVLVSSEAPVDLESINKLLSEFGNFKLLAAGKTS